MFHYGVACALTDLPERQPVILRDHIEGLASTAKKLGYDAIELHLKNPTEYDGSALRRAAENQGISFCGIATGMEYNINRLSLIDDDKQVRRAAVKRLCEHLDLGAELGAPVVVGIMRANIPDFSRYSEYEKRLTDALFELSDYAARVGSFIVVESIMRYINNYLNNVPETRDYLAALGRDNIKLHIDTHSMVVEDADLSAAVRGCKDMLGYVHFSDSNRRYPGGGNIDFKAIMKELKAMDYKGYIALECQPYPTPYDCAKLGIDYVKALETCIEVEEAMQ